MGTGENKFDVMGNQDLSLSLSGLLFKKIWTPKGAYHCAIGQKGPTKEFVK